MFIKHGNLPSKSISMAVNVTFIDLKSSFTYIIFQRVKTSVPHTLPILPYMSVNLSYRNLLAPSRISIKTFFVHCRIFCGFVPYPLKRTCRTKTFVKQFSTKLCIISVKKKTTWLSVMQTCDIGMILHWMHRIFLTFFFLINRKTFLLWHQSLQGNYAVLPLSVASLRCAPIEVQPERITFPLFLMTQKL